MLEMNQPSLAIYMHDAYHYYQFFCMQLNKVQLTLDNSI